MSIFDNAELKFNPEIYALGAGREAFYINLSTDTVRKSIDGAFPYFAKCLIADSAKGKYHRWVAGHDLLVDIPKTYFTHGASKAFKQFGHILLTDFPTKAGIPIPGFSKSGLGELLNQLGIPRGYLSVNLFDTGIGIFACTESGLNLINALNGELVMSTPVFFDTFVKGGIEVAFGVYTENPFLLISGCTDIASGVVAIKNYYEFSYVDFFGPSLISAITSFFITIALCSNDEDAIEEATFSAMKSAAISLAGNYGMACSIGCAIAISAFSLGKFAALKTRREIEELYKVSAEEKARVLKTFINSAEFRGNERLALKQEQADQKFFDSLTSQASQELNLIKKLASKQEQADQKFFDSLASQASQEFNLIKKLASKQEQADQKFFDSLK